MKIFRKVFNALASLAMIAMPVVASGAVGAVNITTNPQNTFSGEPATWTDSLTVTREVEGATNPVVNTFTYEVVEATNYTSPGPVTGLPLSFTIEFDGTEAITGNKATKTGTLDMSTLGFTNVGDYEFIVRETQSSNPSIYPIDATSAGPTEWYVYVSVRYVTSDHTTGGTPTTTIEATLAPQAKKGNSGSKTDIVFNSSAEFTHIALSQDVTGNLADINQYFPVTVTFLNDSVAQGTELVVLGAHSTDGSATVNQSTVTVDGNGSFTIYLKHGQDVTVGLTDNSGSGLEQIPVNVEYTVATTASGYGIYVDDATVPQSGSASVGKTTDDDPTDNLTSFLNEKKSDPITGFFVNYWPFILLVVLGIVGMYIVKKTSKKES